ncbi:MAG: hypothetical protein SFU56_06845 [Capsulimonadales bacterium]|nr:hypothetical protein [Capsulimonadales bacterium]
MRENGNGSGDETGRRWSFRAKAVLWSVISIVAGALGGWIGQSLSAPFYFGFFFTWVLVGLIGMFALAVHVTQEQERRSGKR